MSEDKNNKEKEGFCMRCKNKQASFVCLNCDAFKQFCEQCDYYVHSISSKSNHRRNLIKSILLEDAKMSQNYVNSWKSIDSKSTLNNWLDSTNVEIRNLSKGNVNSVNDSQFSPRNKQESFQSKTNFNVNQSQNKEFLYEKNVNKLENYSKDYVLELNYAHEKEKQDLIQRNNNLINDIDNMRSNFQNQINDFQKQFEEISKKNLMNKILIEEEANIKIKKILCDKDNELRIAYLKIGDLEKMNDSLRNSLNTKTKEHQQFKYEMHDQITKLEFNLRQCEKEFTNMKNYYEEKLKNLQINTDKEKEIIKENYEDTINEIKANNTHLNEKINRLIRDKEKNEENFNKFLEDEKKNSEQKIMIINKTNSDLKEKIDELKSIIQNKEHEIAIWSQKFDENNKLHIESSNTIKLIENENKNLIGKNQNMKDKLSKYDRIVYGKLKIK